MFGILKTGLCEFELWLSLRNFTVLAFKEKVHKDDLKVLRAEAINTITKTHQVTVSLGEEFHIYAKLHQITHFSDLIVQFGPLYNYTTWRFEHKHQAAKRIARRVNNSRNLTFSIHTRLQYDRAKDDSNLDFSSFNFFPPDQTTRTTFQFQIGPSFKLLPASKHPFRLNKRVLKQVLNKRNEWFQVFKFYHDEEKKFCVLESILKQFFIQESQSDAL